MRKQILVVESSAPLRSVAERLLRQEGYEVIAVDSARRAQGVLSVSAVDLAIIGVGVLDAAGKPFYNSWTSGADTKAPFLALATQDATPVDLPDEVIIRAPFTAEELLSRVRIFAGVAKASGRASESPFDSASGSEDDILNTALGLDRIEVQDSETYNDAEAAPGGVNPTSETSVNLDGDTSGAGIAARAAKLSDTAKIDLALMMNKAADKSKFPNTDVSEILEVSDLESHMAERSQRNPQGAADHDYNWLVSEMQKESAPVGAKGASKSAPTVTAAKPVSAGEAELVAKKFVAKAPTVSKNPTTDTDSAIFDWSDSPEQLEKLRDTFSARMISEIAGRVAQQIAEKLNNEKFLSLVENEIRRYLRERH